MLFVVMPRGEATTVCYWVCLWDVCLKVRLKPTSLFFNLLWGLALLSCWCSRELAITGSSFYFAYEVCLAHWSLIALSMIWNRLFLFIQQWIRIIPSACHFALPFSLGCMWTMDIKTRFPFLNLYSFFRSSLVESQTAKFHKWPVPFIVDR